MPPQNIGMDGKIAALESATDASEWNDALIDVLRSGFLSDRNPFGALAKQSLSTLKIRSGVVVPWSGGPDNIPDGWHLCDGRRLPRGGYQELAARLGTKFGPYVGETFQLPDLRRKVVIGRGGLKPSKSLGPGTGIGNTGGRETATLGSATIPAHGHAMVSMTLATVGSHTHQVYEFTTFTSNANFDRAHFSVRRDYLSSNTSATILDQADRHIHFIGGQTDNAGAASPAAITVSGTRVCMHWIIKD